MRRCLLTRRRTIASFASNLAEGIGAAFDADIEHVGFWDLRFAIADTYRAGRVFIAGDAAHTHPPYGGYGINTGFEDAVNLGWKLAAVLQGWGGRRLLDSYSEERQPVFASTSREFIERAIQRDREFLAAFSPERDRDAFERAWAARRDGARVEVGAFEPHYEGSPIVCGPPHAVCSAVGNHAFAARAGHHLAPAVLPSGHNVYERLGDGFTLLAFDAAHADGHAFRRAADHLRIPLDVIDVESAALRERYAARMILVRPDQFVAWAGGAAPQDPTAILRRAVGH